MVAQRISGAGERGWHNSITNHEEKIQEKSSRYITAYLKKTVTSSWLASPKATDEMTYKTLVYQILNITRKYTRWTTIDLTEIVMQQQTNTQNYKKE